MTGLIQADLLKLRSLRSVYVLVVAALVIIASSVTALSLAHDFDLGSQPVRQTVAVAGLGQTFALILGVLAVTGEFRHGTMVSILLVSPRRLPVVASKVLTMLLTGLMLGLVAFGAAAVGAVMMMSARKVPGHESLADTGDMVLGGTLAAAIFAVLGVGIGLVVRNQAGAIIAALALLYAIEPILSVLPGIGDAVQRYGFGGLSSAASGTTALHASADVLGQVPAGLVLAGYAAVFVAVGGFLLSRRDVAE